MPWVRWAKYSSKVMSQPGSLCEWGTMMIWSLF
jgi:hypothetical protein